MSYFFQRLAPKPPTRRELLMKLRKEAIRLKTFQFWDFSLSKAFLAKAGFFYFNNEDQVQCAFCLGVVKGWKITDDPFVVHQRRFPSCTFIAGLSCQNESMTSTPIGLISFYSFCLSNFLFVLSNILIISFFF
jgi:hypothetical protein